MDKIALNKNDKGWKEIEKMVRMQHQQHNTQADILHNAELHVALYSCDYVYFCISRSSCETGRKSEKYVRIVQSQ